MCCVCVRFLLLNTTFLIAGYADGALVAQNPSLAAVGRAYAHFRDVTPENTMVLSIGNGKVIIIVHHSLLM
jgi:patatin-like phospholipase/acyl hydrolase